MNSLSKLIDEKIKLRKERIKNIRHPEKQQKKINRMNGDIRILEFFKEQSDGRPADDNLKKKLRKLLKFFDEELYESVS